MVLVEEDFKAIREIIREEVKAAIMDFTKSFAAGMEAELEKIKRLKKVKE